MNTNPEAWEKSISSLGHELVTALEPVAQKLGVAAEHMYGVLVKQSLVDGISNIAGWGIFAAFILYLGYRLRKEGTAGTFGPVVSRGFDSADAISTSWIVQTLGVIIIAIAVGANLGSILNPEYGAIKTLIDSVHTTCTK
jgi:hypothetical protein